MKKGLEGFSFKMLVLRDESERVVSMEWLFFKECCLERTLMLMWIVSWYFSCNIEIAV